MKTPEPARVTGGADPSAAPEPDVAAEAGTAPLLEADEADPPRPGDSTGVPTPAAAPPGAVITRTAA